jgi:hypothetical protein
MVATNVTLFLFAVNMQAHAIQMREKRKNMNEKDMTPQGLGRA